MPCSVWRRYSGYHFDSETGLYYLKARMYDPEIARFLQEDTYRGRIADPRSLNLYTYCYNNPIRYWDPTGHRPQQLTIIRVDPNANNGIYNVPSNLNNNVSISVSGNTTVNNNHSVSNIITESGSKVTVNNNGSIGNITTGSGSNTIINNWSNISNINNNGTANINNIGNIVDISTGSNSTTNLVNNGVIGDFISGTGSKTTIVNKAVIGNVTSGVNNSLDIRNEGIILNVNEKPGSTINISGNGLTLAIGDTLANTYMANITNISSSGILYVMLENIVEKIAVKLGTPKYNGAHSPGTIIPANNSITYAPIYDSARNIVGYTAKITIGDLTATLPVVVVNGHAIVDSIKLARELGITNLRWAWHEEGDKFASADDAAMAFGLMNTPIYRGREYGANIYLKDEVYTFRDVVIGTRSRVTYAAVNRLYGTLAATVHTHPTSSDFSSADMRNAHNRRVDNYIVTAEGYFKRYDYSNRESITITDQMPFDPRHPDR